MMGYPDDLDVRPLTTWPGQLTPGAARGRSPYSATLSATLADLGRELRALHATRPLLEVAIPVEQWRIDGRPYARAVAEHPGIVLSLPTTSAGPLRFACDRYDTWQANLRAVVLTMEALRAVARHGAVRAQQQYAGFKALPSGGEGAATAPLTVEQAALVVLEAARFEASVKTVEALLTSAEFRRARWRGAVVAAHPDRGGDRQTWDVLEQAKRVLDEHAPVSAS